MKRRSSDGESSIVIPDNGTRHQPLLGRQVWDPIFGPGVEVVRYLGIMYNTRFVPHEIVTDSLYSSGLSRR